MNVGLTLNEIDKLHTSELSLDGPACLPLHSFACPIGHACTAAMANVFKKSPASAYPWASLGGLQQKCILKAAKDWL